MSAARLGLAALLCALAAPALARAAEPARVATLLPYARAALERHPGRVLVVASVRSDPRAPLPDGVADLGSPHSPNLEKLAEARPSLVVGDAQLHTPHRAALERSGARFLGLDSTRVDATFAGLLELGDAVGLRAELAADVEAARKELASLELAKPVPALALFGAPGSFFVVTSGAWLGDLMDGVGLRNLAPTAAPGGRFPGFSPVNDEVLASLEPELVLLVAHGDPEGVRAAFVRELEQRPVWSSVRASARLGVRALDPALFSSNPGLDLPRAARALRDLASAPAP